MQQKRQTIRSAETDDLDFAPESTPYGLMTGSGFPRKKAAAFEDPMGPFPETAVKVFADLGLNSAEIAQYFGVSEKRVAALKAGRKLRTANGRLQEFAQMVRGKLLGSTGG